MSKRLKVVVFLVLFVVFSILAVKTLWVGVNLVMYSNDVVESSQYADSYAQIRQQADRVYNQVMIERNAFYNSSDRFIHWLANMNNNLIRVPLGMLFILSPLLLLYGFRTYNLSQRRRKARTN